MDLILWRHAEAQDWFEGCDDMARTLTPKGEKQAAKMSLWLDRQLPEGTRIWSSPAVRTEQTAKALGRKFKLCKELAPDESVQKVVELIQWPRAKGTIMLVGHQPMLGLLISQALGLQAAECAVKKGAVWWLRNRDRDQHAQTVVVTVQSPETL